MDDDALIELIRAHPADAAEALIAIQPDTDRRLTAETIAAVAGQFGEDPLEFWVERLRAANLVSQFVNAMRARGVAVDDDDVQVPVGGFDPGRLGRFLPRSEAFRCRILVNGKVMGSGVLVGPSLVLTSWHVIAVAAPGQPQRPAPNLSVFLSDGTVQTAGVPAMFESACADDEFRLLPPKRDDDLVGKNDVALLALQRPAAHLGFAPLPPSPPPVRAGVPVAVVHFPEGKDKGIDFGRTRKLRNVTARWRHNVPTRQGSSGGACFDQELRLIGVHQGRLDDRGRFVPVTRFLDDLLPFVGADVAPLALWSLDGTLDSPLVVARDVLFEALAAATEPRSRVRGVRIKRRSIAGGSAGLPFTYEILEALVARKGAGHSVVRVTMDAIKADLVADIARRVRSAGLGVADPGQEAGVAPGQAPPETTAKDRGSKLAQAIESAAGAKEQTLWFFFDNPTVVLTEAARLALEGFVEAALVQPHVRLVIAGFETLPLPGLEFSGPFAAAGDGPPGLVVEFLGGFTRTDIASVLSRASEQLRGEIDVAAVAAAADRVLDGVPDFNSRYRDDQLADVTPRLRAELTQLAAAGSNGNDNGNGGGER